jgi:hypothetical protein
MAETGRIVNALLCKNLSGYRSNEKKSIISPVTQVGIALSLFKLNVEINAHSVRVLVTIWR